MSSQFVIIHEEMGIYVGNAIGLGFWSKLDAVGQDCVPVFESEEQAREHIAKWGNHNDPADYSYASVEVASEATYATVHELRTAGLEEHLGDLAANVPDFRPA